MLGLTKYSLCALCGSENQALVSNFVLSFQPFLFPIFLISFYMIQISVPSLGCLLQFIYSLMILKEVQTFTE